MNETKYFVLGDTDKMILIELVIKNSMTISCRYCLLAIFNKCCERERVREKEKDEGMSD